MAYLCLSANLAGPKQKKAVLTTRSYVHWNVHRCGWLYKFYRILEIIAHNFFFCNDVLISVSILLHCKSSLKGMFLLYWCPLKKGHPWVGTTPSPPPPHPQWVSFLLEQFHCIICLLGHLVFGHYPGHNKCRNRSYIYYGA